MLKKLIAASIIAAFASLTPALAQTPASSTPTAPAANGAMSAQHVTKKPTKMAKKPVRRRIVRRKTVRHTVKAKTKPKTTTTN